MYRDLILNFSELYLIFKTFLLRKLPKFDVLRRSFHTYIFKITLFLNSEIIFCNIIFKFTI